MNLYLIRHTRVDYPSGLCYGQTDVGLSKGYLKKVKKIKSRLKKVRFKTIYSSTLTRCRILAESLAGDPEGIVWDTRLMELNFGEWEGQSWKEIQKSRQAKDFFADYLQVPCPGGEAYTDLLKRVKTFLDELEGGDEDNIMIVSHGGPIKAIYALIKGKDPRDAFDLRVDYGSITIISNKQLKG